MVHSFYRAFEDKFRGSRELILHRLEVYLPFVLPLQEHFQPATAVDLGCGRGEWLELLSRHGFKAIGVDLEEGMLQACRNLHLNFELADALSFLQTLPNSSQAVVSGFHIVEHLPFEAVREYVEEAFRVLKPGGLLILETPNPDNLIVGARNFYLDPTHQRPVPPELLLFLTEFVGFMRSKVLYLQEWAELKNKNDLSLLDVLGGASPDYAVVAQKEGAQELLAALEPQFAKEYGLTVNMLGEKFHQQSEVKAQQLKDYAKSTVTELQARLEQVLDLATSAQTHVEALQARFDHSHAEARVQAGEADALAQQRLQEAEKRHQQTIAALNEQLQQRDAELTAMAVRLELTLQLAEQAQSQADATINKNKGQETALAALRQQQTEQLDQARDRDKQRDT